MDGATFVSVFGSVFEESPWVVEQAWQQAPFESTHSLIEILCQSVKAAGYEQRLVLLRAHPELGTDKQLTDASEKEQKGVGIPDSSDEKIELLNELNQRYRQKFGFPFIVAVKGLTPEMILESLKIRLHNTREIEFRECLEQVFKIARFRLAALLVKE